MNKHALIIGANGQDASYMAELLVSKGYQVTGTVRRNSVPESQTTRIEHLFQSGAINLHYLDLCDSLSVQNVISSCQPDEVYHLGAQSHVQISFELPKYTLDVNAGGTMAVLEAVRKFSPHSRVYNAATSEMFGNSRDSDGYQRETTPMQPVSPYGCAKLYAHNLCHNYRNAYNMFVCSGILFNHESPRRGINFVSNKVVREAVRIRLGHSQRLVLGNLDSYRDWGHARDYVRAMWLMLQQDQADDYVVATGETRSVHDLVTAVFDRLNLDVEQHVETHDRFRRPEELEYLRGDSSKARRVLGWSPTYTFDSMIDEMIDHWMCELRQTS